MIYFKIKNKIYNLNDIKELKKEYPLYYGKLLAVDRVINHELKTTLKSYPEIDIYISTKRINVLGRFSFKYWSREYRRQNKNPYLVLFIESIINCYLWHSVKGLQQVLYHEFLHFKQWLLNEKMGHYGGLHSQSDNTKLNFQLKMLKREVINA